MGLTKQLLDENYRYDYTKNQELDILYFEYQYEQETKKAEETFQICRATHNGNEIRMPKSNDEIHSQSNNQKRIK